MAGQSRLNFSITVGILYGLLCTSGPPRNRTPTCDLDVPAGVSLRNSRGNTAGSVQLPGRHAPSTLCAAKSSHTLPIGLTPDFPPAARHSPFSLPPVPADRIKGWCNGHRFLVYLDRPHGRIDPAAEAPGRSDPDSSWRRSPSPYDVRRCSPSPTRTGLQYECFSVLLTAKYGA